MRAVRLELARVRAGEAAHVACELDHRAVQPETEAEERDLLLARETGGGDLAFDPADAEPAGDHDPVEPAEAALGEQPFGVVGRDPVDLHLRAAVEAAVLQRLDDRQVGVGKVDVLADEADAHRLLRRFHARDELAPLVEVGLVLGEVQHAADVVVEPFVVEHQRDLVQRGCVDARHDALFGHVAEARDLLLQLPRDRPVGAAHDRVGLDAAPAQLGDGVLGELGLLLPCRCDVGNERDVHVEHVVAPDVFAELPDRLEERKDLDVADGAADLGDHDVDGLRRPPARGSAA